MEYESIPIDELLPDPDNARVHGQRNVEAIAASLDEFGQQKPLVIDADNRVLSGNGTLEAAKELGWQRLACVRTDLEGPQAVAYAIADNRTTELGQWNAELLADQLSELTDGLQVAAGFLKTELEDFEPIELADEPEEPPEFDGPLTAGSDASRAYPIVVTPDQRETIDRAIRSVREAEEDDSIKEGRCIELICADFLGGQ